MEKSARVFDSGEILRMRCHVNEIGEEMVSAGEKKNYCAVRQRMRDVFVQINSVSLLYFISFKTYICKHRCCLPAETKRYAQRTPSEHASVREHIVCQIFEPR